MTRWAFPSVSAYNAGVADNGSAISAFNSPLAYLTVTLPSVNTLNPGWTVAIANDNGKVAALQVNATNGGHIVFPGSGATVTSVQLASGNYELALVQFDDRIDTLWSLSQPLDRTQLHHIVDGITPRGAPDIYDGLQQGFQVATAAPVVTDVPIASTARPVSSGT